MAWSWMGGASGWIIPSPNVHTHPHQASTWVGPHITEAGAAVAAAVAVDESRITIVAMTDTTVMTSMITDTAGGALRHLITAGTGLAQDLVHTAHDDTKKILKTSFFFPVCIELYIYKDMKYMETHCIRERFV